MIKIRDLTFEYFDRDEEGYLTDMINAIRGINFDAKKGDFIGVAGKNGSGKSTFAKILNRLLVPIEGTVVIGDINAMEEENTMDIRKMVGMVFQNPDDQIIGSVVAEDVAFGAENIGVPEKELWDRVFFAVERAGLCVFREKKKRGKALREAADRKITELSGGEKQKVAIAGVLAMKPKCIVLDESTSMLDPKSRLEILKLMRELNKKEGITVIMITHMMEELLWADTIYVMDKGRIALKGRKEVIFSEENKLKELGLELPEIIKIRNGMISEGLLRNQYIFDIDDLVERVKKEHPNSFYLDTGLEEVNYVKPKIDPVNAILFNNLSFAYGKKQVLRDISFGIGKGEYVAIVGNTGSGKSTLLQHIPALLKGKTETVYVDGLDVMDRTTDIQKLRCKIGYVFQYPEQQLFAKNVYEDVVFGPRNVGVTEVEAEKRAYEAIKLVGLSDEIYDTPINKLSGGEKRRVALAGVLAMKPEYLILDEPVAGLDPQGKENMLKIIDTLHKEAGITIIMVSHDIESVAKYADRVIVMEEGALKYNGKPKQVFYQMALDSEEGADNWNIPVMMQLLVKLRKKGLPVNCDATDIANGIRNIKGALVPYSR